MRPSRVHIAITLLLLLVLVIWAIPTAANFAIEYNWWKEIGQIPTWFGILWYRTTPVALGTLVAFLPLYLAYTRGLHFAGIRPRDVGQYHRLIAVGLALVALVFASATIDYWTVMRFFGSRGLSVSPDAWRDPVFSHGLPFYLFDLPFYSDLLGFIFTLAILSALVFWATARGWQLIEHIRFRYLQGELRTNAIDFGRLLLPGAARAGFVRVIAVILLLGFAAWVFLGNYELLYASHPFMTGADYVDERITLPLRWLLIIASLAAVPLVWKARFKKAIFLVVGFFLLQLAVPAIVHAFNATITQIQALRPYYTFPETDVDRYLINGRIKQVLLSPRELDVTQLSAEASQSWINPHFIYTHGIGAVVAEVNKITPDGLPVLLIENAPPEIKSPGFQLTRPEIYFGEKTQDPVFVHTAREEFDYPSGDQNKYTTYQGTGGFPVGSPLLKAAAAISQGRPALFSRAISPGRAG